MIKFLAKYWRFAFPKGGDPRNEDFFESESKPNPWNRQRITMTFEVEGYSNAMIDQLKEMTPEAGAAMRFGYSNLKVTAAPAPV